MSRVQLFLPSDRLEQILRGVVIFQINLKGSEKNYQWVVKFLTRWGLKGSKNISSILRGLIYLSPFRKADTNGDGEVSFREFLAAFANDRKDERRKKSTLLPGIINRKISRNHRY